MGTFKVGKTYLTLDGASVKIVDDDGAMLTGVITAENGLQMPGFWHPDGKFHYKNGQFMALQRPKPVMETVWLNVYKEKSSLDNCPYAVYAHVSEGAGLQSRDRNNYMGTFPFSFEVPDDE